MNPIEFEREVETKWRSTPNFYEPLRISSLSFEPLHSEVDERADLLFDLEWREKTLRFVGEIKMEATPQTSRRLETFADFYRSTGTELPALVTSYLSRGIVEQLEALQISGFDLNGNYYIVTPELIAVRLDKKNQYPSSRDIKKIFSYNSSIVSRFLLRENRVFEQVNEVLEGIEACGGGISLSTVSKVLKGLEDELLIDRSQGVIRVLQPAKMLERLKMGYRSPRINGRLKLKLPGDVREMSTILSELLEGQYVWSGESSAPVYATTTPEAVRTAYTRSKGKLAVLRQYEDDRFYNCIVEQTDDDFVYFDSNDGWASRIETYLALSQLDKREQEIAADIAEDILEEFARNV